VKSDIMSESSEMIESSRFSVKILLDSEIDDADVKDDEISWSRVRRIRFAKSNDVINEKNFFERKNLRLTNFEFVEFLKDSRKWRNAKLDDKLKIFFDSSSEIDSVYDSRFRSSVSLYEFITNSYEFRNNRKEISSSNVCYEEFRVYRDEIREFMICSQKISQLKADFDVMLWDELLHKRTRSVAEKFEKWLRSEEQSIDEENVQPVSVMRKEWRKKENLKREKRVNEINSETGHVNVESDAFDECWSTRLVFVFDLMSVWLIWKALMSKNCFDDSWCYQLLRKTQWWEQSSDKNLIVDDRSRMIYIFSELFIYRESYANIYMR
jgi:hypothetical protein